MSQCQNHTWNGDHEESHGRELHLGDDKFCGKPLHDVEMEVLFLSRQQSHGNPHKKSLLSLDPHGGQQNPNRPIVQFYRRDQTRTS